MLCKHIYYLLQTVIFIFVQHDILQVILIYVALRKGRYGQSWSRSPWFLFQAGALC